jgi:hypothetical protein
MYKNWWNIQQWCPKYGISLHSLSFFVWNMHSRGLTQVTVVLKRKRRQVLRRKPGYSFAKETLTGEEFLDVAHPEVLKPI